jgi:hydrogenase nickel incorporation protein HypA/HybF
MRDLLRKVLEVAATEGATRVVSIQVRLGALSHMSPEHFQEHFEHSAAGTLAEGAIIRALVDADIRSPTAADVLLEGLEVE